MTKSISIKLPEELLKQVDERAKSLHMTRTAYIIHSLVTAINQEDIMNSLPTLMKAVNLMQQEDKAP